MGIATGRSELTRSVQSAGAESIGQVVNDGSSRRALLAAVVGGLGALVASALARPFPARAGTDGDVVLGGVNAAPGETSIHENTTEGVVLRLQSQLGTPLNASTTDRVGAQITSYKSPGVWGESSLDVGVVGQSASTNRPGVRGMSGVGSGVQGFSGTKPAGTTVFWPDGAPKTGVHGYAADDASVRGVFGESTIGVGVYGANAAASVPAILGHGRANGTGMQGYSGGTALPGPTPAKTGVYGYAAQDTNARGVLGHTTVGRGVHGQATSGVGVGAVATTGTALLGVANTNGTALATHRGLVRFNTAGLANIVAGTSSVRVTPGFDILDSISKVFAVLQGDPGPGIVVRYVLKDDPNNRFTIQLSGNVVRTTQVAWFVLS
jgi:hypothetical protein